MVTPHAAPALPPGRAALHLDWYDRCILDFVLSSAMLTTPPRADGGVVQFGLTERRLRHRFDAVVDQWRAHLPHLAESDRALVERAERCRADAQRLTAT
jgi:hypothetical protein